MITSKSKKEKNNIFVLKQKIREAEGVLTLKFLPAKGAIFSFEPGKFVLISFLNNRANGKIRAYSISSCPQDKFLAITVKKIGVFSSALHNLKIGEKVEISHSQGNFYPKKSMKNLVFLAAGTGIAPFYSIIKNFYLEDLQKKITLFYSNKTKKEIVFFNELNEIAKKWPNFKVIYTLTREKSEDKKIKEFNRFNIKTIKKYLKTFREKHYFICGPIEFVNDLQKELKKAGVKENFIKIEVF